MNPVLEEIYSTILPSAPFLIAAYAGVLVVLFVYVFFVMRKLKAAERKMEALEERLQRNEKAE